MILLDEFYKDLYMNVFKKWICMQENPNYIIKEHKDFIQIESSYGIAEVTFNLYCIIELKVVSKKKNEIDFYLHFQMNTLKHAVSLFNEMLESLLKLSDEAKTKVLLCCSGGLTTSYFAREINEANKLLKNAIEVSAVGYNQLYQIGKQFDIIFLAPQISYLHAQIQSILKEQVVLKIPPLVFARYDVGTMIKDIEQAQIKKTKQIKKEEISLKLKITNKKPIVCLVIYKNKEKFSADKLFIYEGDAAKTACTLPEPDKVFIGGSGKELSQILETIAAFPKKIKVVISAVTIETIAEANELLGKYDTDFDVIQATVGRGRKIGSYHIMDTNNPVMIFTAHI